MRTSGRDVARRVQWVDGPESRPPPTCVEYVAQHQTADDIGDLAGKHRHGGSGGLEGGSAWRMRQES